MGAYSRVDDNVDVYDEYHDCEGDDTAPNKEVLEYLELRQKLKEEARRKMAKESGSPINFQHTKRLPLHNFGSFFGPSRPVIADRVIQKCKSFLENQPEATRVSSSHKDGKKGNASDLLENGTSVQRPLDPIKTKVQLLKNTRDYSFLLSDDADVPGAANGLPPLSNSDCKRADKLTEHKKQVPVGSYGSVPGQPPLPSKAPLKKPLCEKLVACHVERKASVSSVVKKPPMVVAKGAISHGQYAPLVKSRTAEERRCQEFSKSNILARETLSLKPDQIKASKQVSSQVGRGDDPYRTKLKPKPKPNPDGRFTDEDDDEGLRAIAEIRKMCRYNPNRYAGDEDDLSDMEVDFRTIQREELRSSRIAREEDERELRLIQEEEERERQRKLAKKRKMG